MITIGFIGFINIGTELRFPDQLGKSVLIEYFNPIHENEHANFVMSYNWDLFLINLIYF